MKKLLVFIVLLLTAYAVLWVVPIISPKPDAQGAPPYDVAYDEEPETDRLNWLRNWQRPEGPAKVGLQVGHWKNDELPEELEKLKGSTGSQGAGKIEWEVNLAIAEGTKKLLEEKGIVVDLLPATVPHQYWADVFVAIHADGSTDRSKTGFKAAAPRRSMNQQAGKLLELIENSYAKVTDMDLDPNVTRNMRGYYAFAWWRYTHSVHPMTAAVILETGFLTSPVDRKIIVNASEIPAQGLANGIIEYLESEGLFAVGDK